MWNVQSLCAAAVVYVAGVAGGQTIIHVDDDAMSGGDGSSWGAAFSDLQDALDAAAVASSPVEVWVAAGAYRPDRGTGDRAASFEMFDGLTIRGGFAGGESSPQDRPASGAETVLTGEIGSILTTLDNSLHVVQFEDFFASGAIDRVTIRSGRADGGGDDGEGGGLRMRFATLDVTDCVFENNWAENGGGLYAESGFITVIDSTFRNNFADLEGGGARLRDDLAVLGCRFVDNTAGFGGGLAACCVDAGGGTVVIDACTFEGNFADFGGGLFLPNGVARASSCVLTGNSASRGGGVYNASGDGVMVNCFFGRNVGDLGGAVYNSGVLTLAGGVLSRNTAFTSGGGVYLMNEVMLANCTVTSNSCLFGSSGGGIHSVNGPVTLANSILWGNSNGVGSDETGQVRIVSGGATFSFSNIEGWTGLLPSVGCISVSPQFMNPYGADGLLGTPDDDYRPAAGSPVIDAGENALVPSDVTDVDLDGDVSEALPRDVAYAARFVDAPLSPDVGSGSSPLVDMGAFEYQPACLGDVEGDGLVDFADLNEVLSRWGEVASPGDPVDIDGSGLIDFGDVNVVLAQWGIACD